MRARTAATAVATLALAVAVAVGVVVATPGLAFALFTPHDPSAPVSSAVRPRLTSSPTSSATAGSGVPYSGPLVGARGSMPITRGQLHTWVLSRSPDDSNTRTWEAETWLDITCMARKGFLYDPTNPRLHDREVAESDGLTTKQLAAYDVAMYGPPTDAPYDWRTAGCHGRSVHVMGQDDAH